MAIVGLIIFIGGTISSMLIYPDYSFSEQYISDLGRDHTSIIFNYALRFTSILILPWFLGILFLFNTHSLIDQVLVILIAVFGYFSSLFLFLLSIYTTQPSSYHIHAFVAIKFFQFIAMVIFIKLVYTLLPGSLFTNNQKVIIGSLGTILFVLDIILIYFPMSGHKILQKIVVFLSVIFLITFIYIIDDNRLIFIDKQKQ